MSTTRWDPFRDVTPLRDAMNRVFDDAFVHRTPRRTNGRSSRTIYRLPVDVFETSREFVVEAVVPGISERQAEIAFEDGTLTISGEMPARTEESVTYHLRERWHGQFERSISFPNTVDADGIEATLENGLLRIRLPKAETAQPRRIPVTTKA